MRELNPSLAGGCQASLLCGTHGFASGGGGVRSFPHCLPTWGGLVSWPERGLGFKESRWPRSMPRRTASHSC